MATTFLEPGGDADFAVANPNGFWKGIAGSPAVATDFVHGTHVKSIQYPVNAINNVRTANLASGILADAGSRISIYIYLNVLPSATASIFTLHTPTSGTDVDAVTVRLTSGGVLQLWNKTVAQIGTNGSTLSTGVWYRLSLAYTITSTTVNEFRLFKNGTIDISVTNGTLTSTNTANLRIGNIEGNLTLDFRSSDHYVDSSNSLTDPGDIWVTAKRPISNGTTNGFTTQIGAGGSGYGTGHSPQVNERPLSTTNGWSMIGAGAAVTEEYNIEGKAIGDIDISTATIVDWLGWVSVKALAGTPTIQIILSGANNAQAISTTITLYTKVKGSSTYPAGTGADIGIVTDTSLTTESLYECGVLVAFIPGVAPGGTNHFLNLLGVGI